jgi:hypothetical protein
MIMGMVILLDVKLGMALIVLGLLNVVLANESAGTVGCDHSAGGGDTSDGDVQWLGGYGRSMHVENDVENRFWGGC